MAQIVADDGTVCGAGFLVAPDELVTCAHVVEFAGHGPGGHVRVAFPGLVTAGLVLADGWDEDVAYLRLAEAPADVAVLGIGTAVHSRDRAVRSFGFPSHAPSGGHFGYARAGDLLPGKGWLQLTAANSLTRGFSGAPVVDDTTGLVIGMLTTITPPDGFSRGLEVAYATSADTLRTIRPLPYSTPESPFRGLEVFTAADERLFRGRDSAVESVLNRLRGPRRLLLLLGPSGAGKSSLVQAGVLPALARGALPGSDRWRPMLVTRSGQELPDVPDRGEQHLLLVVDQFEEFLTDPAAIDRILELVSSRAAVSVVLIMRDDFYPQLAAMAPALLELAGDGQVNVPTTLGRSDLRAIVERAGVTFEQGLVERIISDVQEGGSAPIASLAPLELALTQLWERRQDGRLTHEEYEAIHGVAGSLATWCTTAIGHLTDEQFRSARTILAALVRPPEPERNTPATRQRRPVSELRELAREGADEVIASLTRDRVIITYVTDAGDRVAELAHDTLTRDWGDLRDWVRQDGHFNAWVDRVRTVEARWATTRSADDLLHGTDLAEGLAWQADKPLPGKIADFVEASLLSQEGAIRRARRINVILAVALVAALAAGGIAVWQQQVAASGERQALSGQLTLTARDLLESDPDTAALLAVRAYQTHPDARSLAMLRSAGGLPLNRRFVAAGPVGAVALSRDGRVVAAGGGRSVQLWDVESGALRSKRDLGGEVTAMALSPDGGTLAAGAGTVVSAWGDAAVDDRVNALEFSPDGSVLAIATNGSTWLWRKGEQKPAKIPGQGLARSVSFSPDGQTLALVDHSDMIRLHDLDSGGIRTLTQRGLIFKTVRFNPANKKKMATVNDDWSIRLWDLVGEGGKSTMLDLSESDRVDAIAFSADGRTLAVGGGDYGSGVFLLDAEKGDLLTTVTGHTAGIKSLAFSSDGRTFVSGSADGTVRVWDTTIGRPVPGTSSSDGTTSPTARSADGRIVAVVDEENKQVVLRETETGRQRLVKHDLYSIESLALSQDGRTVAASGVDGTILVWDVVSGAPRPTPPSFAKREIPAMAFSGDVLSAIDANGVVWSWNRVTGQTSRFGVTATECDDATGPTVAEAAFDALGRTLAFADNCGRMRLWDITSARHLGTFVDRTFMLNGLRTLAFSADGATLTRRGVTWDVELLARAADPGVAVKRICAAVRRDLTEAERATYLIDSTPTCPEAS